MLDAIILSDLHLGSDNCQARRLCRLLESVAAEELPARRLVLNGDVFDSIDFRRLKRRHWKVLSLLRKLSDHLEIVWICGNHDGSAEIVSHLLGVTVVDEYVFESGGKKVLVLHGHAFDEFLDAHPFLTRLADCVYFLLQKLDRTHAVAKFAKTSSKTFLRCAKKIEERSLEYARRKGCAAVCCGHTHHAEVNGNGKVAYYNSGCWTEWPGTYLTAAGGRIELHYYAEELVEAGEEVAAV